MSLKKKKKKQVKLNKNVRRLYKSVYCLLKFHMFWAVTIGSQTHMHLSHHLATLIF